MKTIFITFSVHNVFRNLFLFPGGFRDQLLALLRQRKDIRVVCILRTRDREKYASLFESDVADRFILETADTPGLKNILQKSFRFFYAYLTYTNTTRILTTMGMRVDEPPGASNRALFLLRAGISFFFGHFDVMKRRVIPYLHARIFPERPFRELFEKYMPVAVFGTHIYGEYDAYLLREAHLRKVKTLAMPSGWDHMDKYFLPIHADTILVPSEQVKEHALRFQGYRTEEVIVTGYPHFDFLTSDKSTVSREEILTRCGFPKDARFIFYVSGSAYCPDEPDIIEQVAEWIEKNELAPNTYLVLRPYLGSRSKDREFDQKKFARLTRHPRVFYYDAKSWDTLADSIFFINLMRHADVVMCAYSTVFLESALFDRPLVAATFDGNHTRPYHRSIRRFADFEHFKDVLSLGAIRQVFTFSELKTVLVDYLQHPERDASAREMFRQKACYKLDGGSSKRIIDALVNACM